MSLLRAALPRVALRATIATPSIIVRPGAIATASVRSFYLQSTSIRQVTQPTGKKIINRRFVSGGSGPATPKKDSFPILPIIAIFLVGSGVFFLLVKQREASIPNRLKSKERDMSDIKALPSPVRPTPAFDPKDVTVIFVLGGPGAGKGTQCANLVRDYKFAHYSAGDLLRAEQVRPNSEFGELIKTYIREGKIVPMEVTIALLENAIREEITTTGIKRFLIDGFPRQMDQALKFEETVCPSKLTLFFDTTEEVMLKRLLKRGETSGREDDNIESIKKRFRTFVQTSMPVVDYYEKLSKVVKVDASKGVDEVYQEVRKRFDVALKD